MCRYSCHEDLAFAGILVVLHDDHSHHTHTSRSSCTTCQPSVLPLACLLSANSSTWNLTKSSFGKCLHQPQQNGKVSKPISSLPTTLACAGSSPYLFGKALSDHCVQSKNVVVPVHASVLHNICVGVPVTVTFGELPRLADRQTHHQHSILLSCLLSVSPPTRFSHSISVANAPPWRTCPPRSRLAGCTFVFVSLPPAKNTDEPSTFAFSVLCVALPQRLSLRLLPFACWFITWVCKSKLAPYFQALIFRSFVPACTSAAPSLPMMASTHRGLFPLVIVIPPRCMSDLVAGFDHVYNWFDCKMPAQVVQQVARRVPDLVFVGFLFPAVSKKCRRFSTLLVLDLTSRHESVERQRGAVCHLSLFTKPGCQRRQIHAERIEVWRTHRRCERHLSNRLLVLLALPRDLQAEVFVTVLCNGSTSDTALYMGGTSAIDGACGIPFGLEPSLSSLSTFFFFDVPGWFLQHVCSCNCFVPASVARQISLSSSPRFAGRNSHQFCSVIGPRSLGNTFVY